MQAYYCQPYYTKRPCQSQASGWLLYEEGKETGWESHGPPSTVPRPTPWELFPSEVARQVFNTKGLRAIQTPGEVTGVQEELYFLFSPPPRTLNVIKK